MSLDPAHVLYVLCLMEICITIGCSHSVENSTIVRPPRDTYWNEPSALYTPPGHTADREMRSSILMELRRDLVPSHGPSGLHGICMRVYRVLHDTFLPPAEECRHHNSRQSILGDITEFYHTLVESGLFNRTIEFPLADRFKRFSFRASFVHLPSKGSEPAVLIETASQSGQVVCVESVNCPPTTTVTSSTVKPTPAVPPDVLGGTDEKKAAIPSSDDSTPNSRDASLGGTILSGSVKSTAPFWDTLLSGTEPKSWFLATVTLSGLCLTLIIVLLVTWIYVCRLRRLHARRRCRGTCRFGCRCPPEVIRQAVNSAAVHGPLDSQNVQLFGCPLTPHGNGSIRSGSGFGATVFSGGTMTSSRWGSNGCQKLGSPLYVSLANATDKATLLANCSIATAASGPLDALNESWSLTNGQRPPSQTNRRRTSQNVNCRSTSDGSSMSDQPAPNCGLKTGVGNHLRACLAVGFSGGPVDNCSIQTSAPPTMLINGVNTYPPDTCGSVCYQTSPLTCYGVTNGTKMEGTGPRITQSPTQLATRKTVERCYYNSSVGLGNPAGLVAAEDEKEPISQFYSAVGEKMPLEVPNQQEACIPFNSRVPSALQQTSLYPVRGSESDLLNITPPSGFYDPHSVTVDSGLVNGSLTSSSFRPSTQNDITGYAARSFMGSSLYPVLGSPRNHQGWSRASPGAEMVGAVELGGALRAPTTSLTTHPTAGHVTFKPADLGANSPPKEANHPAPKQMLSPRFFAASERML